MGRAPVADHEVLEADPEGAVPGQVTDLDLAAVGVDLDDLVLGAHVDAHRSRGTRAGVRTTSDSMSSTSPATWYGMPQAE